MILPMINSEMHMDMVAGLERKMVRIRALHRELIRILDAEYVAGMAYDPKTLNRLFLRKKNCVNRFEHLVRAVNEQLQIMVQRPVPKQMPRTLETMIKMIPELKPEQTHGLCLLAKDLEKRHGDLMTGARRNALLFKNVLSRLHATSSYARHGKAMEP